MERLDGPLAELVAAERVEVDAISKSPEAAWAGIAEAWQAPPPVPPAGASEAATVTAGKAGLLKVVAAVVVGTSVAAGAWAMQGPKDDAPLARVEPPAVAPSPVTAPPMPNLEAAPVSAAPPPRPHAALAPATTRPSSTPRTAPRPGLAQELALVDAMRRDVAAGRFAEALTGAKEHRTSFAKGSLIADRMDLEAAARCGRGDIEAGKKLAERKAKRWPRAPMSDRLRTLCRLEKP